MLAFSFLAGLGGSGFGVSLGGDIGDVFGLLGSLLLLKILGEELLVSDVLLLALLPSLSLLSLVEDLSSDSLLGDESLDLGGLVEGLVSSLELSSHDVLSDIVLLSQHEGLSDPVGSLWSESSWPDAVGESLDVLLALDQDLEGNDGKVGSADATSDGLSLSLSGPPGSVESGPYN